MGLCLVWQITPSRCKYLIYIDNVPLDFGGHRTGRFQGHAAYRHIREFVHDAILILGWHTRDANGVPQQRQWIYLLYYRGGHAELHLLVWQIV